jgi:hypothetical protein
MVLQVLGEVSMKLEEGIMPCGGIWNSASDSQTRDLYNLLIRAQVWGDIYLLLAKERCEYPC